MVLFRAVSEQRRKQILAYVAPHLGDTEEVVGYARARDPDTHRKGFAFLTPERFVVAWKDSGDGVAVPWSEVRAWGLKTHSMAGPVLRVEGEQDAITIELRTTTHAMTRGAREFVRSLADLVPAGAGSPTESGFDGTHHGVNREEMSPARLTRRIVITVAAVALIVFAGVIAIVPGPWSILLVIAGLAVLATEYDWAEDALDWAREQYKRARAKLRERRSSG